MNMSASRSIWFWQRIVSPHMAGLAVALARRGCKVTYAAEENMSADRAQQGWAVPVLPGVDLVYGASQLAVQSLVRNAPPESVHICQGVRSNGLVASAQRALAARGLRQWVVMETVNDAGWIGCLKRAEYRRLFYARAAALQGVLATGYRTADWVAARGMRANQVYPFAYFLPDGDVPSAVCQREPGPFRFVFAGQLIPRKRVDWLISALAGLTQQAFELWIVGTGPQEPALRALAGSGLGDRVRWMGQLPLTDVPAVLAQADCLVLPSVHDGWGAVVSEALMAGTPVICSDACGAAGVVRASGLGGVFGSADRAALACLLEQALGNGPLPLAESAALAGWAGCLGGRAGADYLMQILDHTDGRSARPLPPWSLATKASNFGERDAR